MNQTNDIHPPKWPLKILRFFVKKEFLEEIEGDMEELFFENAEKVSLRKAKNIYTAEVFKLLRPILLRNIDKLQLPTQFAMYKNYFKIAWRNLIKRQRIPR